MFIAKLNCSFLLLLALHSGINAQTLNTNQSLLVQFNKKKSVDYGRIGKDSMNVVLQIINDTSSFPSVYFIKARVLGNGGGLSIDIPESIKNNKNGKWIFSEYIATASNGNNFVKAEEYAVFQSSPFDFEFISVPPSADIYLVPLDDWIKIFNRSDLNFQFDKTKLSMVVAYNILRPTPCHYSVFEQPYIGVFVNDGKVRLEYISPKRNVPGNNKAEIRFNN